MPVAIYTPESTWEPNPTDETVPNDVMADNGSWSAKRDALAQQIWANMGGTRI